MSNTYEEIKAEFDNVESEELAARKRVDQTRAAVIELTNQVQNLSNEQIEAVRRFRDEIEVDLHRFNEDRLAAYIRLAKDISMPAQQKLALAISGWLWEVTMRSKILLSSNLCLTYGISFVNISMKPRHFNDGPLSSRNLQVKSQELLRFLTP